MFSKKVKIVQLIVVCSILVLVILSLYIVKAAVYFNSDKNITVYSLGDYDLNETYEVPENYQEEEVYENTEKVVVNKDDVGKQIEPNLEVKTDWYEEVHSWGFANQPLVHYKNNEDYLIKIESKVLCKDENGAVFDEDIKTLDLEPHEEYSVRFRCNLISSSYKVSTKYIDFTPKTVQPIYEDKIVKKTRTITKQRMIKHLKTIKKCKVVETNKTIKRYQRCGEECKPKVCSEDMVISDIKIE